jgi:hypothetical protein
MCDINFNKKSNRKSGYKVVAVDSDNNVYSIFTGQMYKQGMVEPPPDRAKPITEWNSELHSKLLRNCFFYKNVYVGHTSVFINMKDAKLLFNRFEILNKKEQYKLKIAKFTFAGNTFIGEYQYSFFQSNLNVIAGNNIESIEILN